MNEPMQVANEVDVRIPRSFPSAVEIIGAVAAGIPLIVQSSSSSSRTVDGQVVEFVYRDWIAVGAGAAAALAGLVSLLLVARTDRAKRAARTVVALVLLAGGAFWVLRGFGVVGIESPSTTSSMTVAPSIDLPAVAPAPAVDAKAVSERFFAKWRADQLDSLADDMKLSKQDRRALHRLYELYTPQLGPVVRVNEATVAEAREGAAKITGDVLFEKSPTTFVLIATLPADGAPFVSGVDIALPDAIHERLEAEATPASAERAAHAALATILTGKLADAMPAFDLKLIENIPDNFEPALAEVVQKIGPKPTIALTKHEDCAAKDKDVPHMRCLAFALTSGRRKSTATVDLGYRVGRWYVFSFNVTPPAK